MNFKSEKSKCAIECLVRLAGWVKQWNKRFPRLTFHCLTTPYTQPAPDYKDQNKYETNMNKYKTNMKQTWTNMKQIRNKRFPRLTFHCLTTPYTQPAPNYKDQNIYETNMNQRYTIMKNMKQIWNKRFIRLTFHCLTTLYTQTAPNHKMKIYIY